VNHATTLISVQDLEHRYLPGTPLEVQALRGVSLSVSAGSTVGIVGPTGSGKSTLLQHLNGLFRPQAGEVSVLGKSLSDPAVDMREIRQRVGLVFQSPEDQLFEQYAGDDVAFGPRAMGLSHQEVRRRVQQAMEAVGLPFEYKDRLTAELSQGERRRLALAGVLALQPQMLVLDEPTAGLDPRGRRNLLGRLSSWAAGGRRAIVLATHNMEDIAQLANYVYVLVRGTIVLHGPTRHVFRNADILFENGLSLPVALQVVRQLHQRGFAMGADGLTSDEVVQQIGALFDV
jgi:energy-coupling factor transport system ATP-binding protein